MGREGEVVKELIPDFEKENPGVKVEVQQMPWTAAHEKLLTAHVGYSTPDVSQMGNTWIPEFVALNALEDLTERVNHSRTISPENYFTGIWKTNVLGSTVFGVPWYVDTRVLFYRKDILEEAGISRMALTWDEWLRMMQRIKSLNVERRFAILLPTDEWAQPVIFALQQGSEILKDGNRYAAVREPGFRKAFEFYIDLFQSGFAPVASNVQIANVFQQFAQGDFAMYITGPWNLGEFRRRLPRSLDGKWGTSPLPAPHPNNANPGVSLAGGSSLVLFKNSKKKDASWKLIEYLSRPEQQIRFFSASGDLPARIEAWQAPLLSKDEFAQAFYEQLKVVKPCPQVPEWEQIAQRIAEISEQAIRGGKSVEEALRFMESDINRMLEKRRWMMDRKKSTTESRRHGVQ
ncbi:sugar ABC transporter substrate-binding protein [bacterium]|nr:sugar ABC transporter substrate-binding protein [bacterium]